MKQQGKLPLANGEALLAAKSGREKGRNGFGRAALEVSFSRGGRLLGQGAMGAARLWHASALSATPPPPATLGPSPGCEPRGVTLRTNRIW